jgi:hypothetical protein
VEAAAALLGDRRAPWSGPRRGDGAATERPRSGRERKEDGVQYIFLIYGDQSEGGSASPEEMAKSMQEWGDYTQYLKDKGYHLAGEALYPTHDATTVRVRDGKTITTDGPFAETKEQLGGFYLVDCPSLDEAIEASAKMPVGPNGSVEIRPVMLFDEEGHPSS